MRVRIQKWGNSQGLRIPRDLLERTGLTVGSEVELKPVKGKLVIEAGAPRRGKYRIEDLVARMPKHYRVKEVPWGPPAGNEVW